MATQHSAPPSPGADGTIKKKPNPLSDFIETEKAYVELLTGIIRVRQHNNVPVSAIRDSSSCAESCLRLVASKSPSSGVGQDVSEYRERVQSKSVITRCV